MTSLLNDFLTSLRNMQKFTNNVVKIENLRQIAVCKTQVKILQHNFLNMCSCLTPGFFTDSVTIV